MALPEFKNEQEFRDNWIAPFLAKLGFMNIKNTHGPGEQGKDFFFTDYDRFGHSRYYAAQVKLGNIGSGGKEINDLLDQVKRCFGVKLRFHKGAHEQSISAVYVMTSGTISEQARQRIHDWCGSEHYGENVYFLDGEQLENKNRFATYESDQEKRQHYTALFNEVARNQLYLKEQIDSFQKANPIFSRYRLRALESGLRRLPLYGGTQSSIAANLEKGWRLLTTCNLFNDNIAVLLRTDLSFKEELRQMLISLETELQIISFHCTDELKKLNERYSLEATAVEPDSPL